MRIPQIGEWLIWLLATFISKFIKVATKCYAIIPQEVYIPSMWNFMAGRRDPALSSLWNRYSHLETIPQHNEFEAEIMVCEISQYLSTKTSSSVRFFYNMELWKLCFPPENWIKMKSIVIMFPLKSPPNPKSSSTTHSPLLEICFCYCKFARSPIMEGGLFLPWTCHLQHDFDCVCLNLSNLKLTMLKDLVAFCMCEIIW